jgi:hypothetical protein
MQGNTRAIIEENPLKRTKQLRIHQQQQQQPSDSEHTGALFDP